MITLAAWLHTLDPVALDLGVMKVRWYGLSYVAAFAVAAMLWTRLARAGWAATPPHRVFDAMFIVILGTLLGGRLGYVAFYQPALLTELTPGFPWWGALAINRGGMASHGGMIGLVIAAWVVSRGWRRDESTAPGPEAPRAAQPGREGRCSLLHVMDTLALLAPPGLLLGRVANFINGELLGKIVVPGGTPAPWWSVRYPQELRGWIAPGVRDLRSHAPELTPQQEGVLLGLVERARPPGLGGDEGFAVAIERLIARAGDYRDQLELVVSARHPSQLYQALAEGVVLGVVLWFVRARVRTQGLVAAWFFVLYGVLRVVTEFWRLPDAQFAVGRPLGLSRGQWLSVVMVAVGLALAGWLTTRARRAGAARRAG